MKSRHVLAVVLILIAIGSWVYVTRPARQPPAPQKIVHKPFSKTPSLLLEMEANDKKDAIKSHQMPPKVLAAKIAKLKKSQKVVNGMVQIKPGQSGVVTIAGDGLTNSTGESLQANNFKILLPSFDFGGETNNGSADTNGFIASWIPFDDYNAATPPSLDPRFAGSLPALVQVPVGAASGTYRLDATSSGNTSPFVFGTAQGTFTVPGDLTGSIYLERSVSAVPDKKDIYVALKADTTTGNKVVSAVIDWGDGSSTTVSPAPDSQHYTARFIHHAYTSEGTFTITVTYTDDASPTPNTVEASVDVDICFNTQAELDEFYATYGQDPTVAIYIEHTSSTQDEVTGIWTHCYTASLPDAVKERVDAVSDATGAPAGMWGIYEYDGISVKSVNEEGDIHDTGPFNYCVTSANSDPDGSFGIVKFTATAFIGDCTFGGGGAYISPPTSGDCGDGYHDDGTGNCVANATNPDDPNPCADGFHDDGTGVCVANATNPDDPNPCGDGFHDDGTGVCVANAANPDDPNPCADGYHDDGTGVCVANATNPDDPNPCADGYHDDGTGVCVANATNPDDPNPCADGYHDDGTGVCVPDTASPTQFIPPAPSFCLVATVVQANESTKYAVKFIDNLEELLAGYQPLGQEGYRFVAVEAYYDDDWHSVYQYNQGSVVYEPDGSVLPFDVDIPVDTQKLRYVNYSYFADGDSTVTPITGDSTDFDALHPDNPDGCYGPLNNYDGGVGGALDTNIPTPEGCLIDDKKARIYAIPANEWPSGYNQVAINISWDNGETWDIPYSGINPSDADLFPGVGPFDTNTVDDTPSSPLVRWLGYLTGGVGSYNYSQIAAISDYCPGTGSGSGSGSGDGSGGESGSGASGGTDPDDSNAIYSPTTSVTSFCNPSISATTGCVATVDAISSTAILAFTVPTSWPSDATSGVLEQWNGSAWNTVATVTSSQAGGQIGVSITQLTYLHFRWKLLIAGEEGYYTSNEMDVTTSCCGGGGGGQIGSLLPAIPSPPAVVKDCDTRTTTITVTVPGDVDFIEIARNDAPTTPIHTFTQSGNFTDTTVGDNGTYLYRARANHFGFVSDWSAWSTEVEMGSDTLTVTLVSPMANAEISKYQDLVFTTHDTNADWDAEHTPDPLPACTDDLNLKVLLDGVDIPGAELIEGTIRNGTWRIANWDTRNYANGARTLLITCQDVNCCPAYAAESVLINNVPGNDTLYLHSAWLRKPPQGCQYNKAYLSCQVPPVNINPWRRWWVRNAVVKSNTTDWTSSDADALNTAFQALQQVVLSPVRVQPDGTKEYGTKALIHDAGDEVHWIQQWIPQHKITYFETGLDQVVKIRPVATDKSVVFATSDTNAKLFTYSQSTFTELVDFSEHNAENVTDVAVLGDDVFAVVNDQLIAVDTISGYATLNLLPRGETRPPVFVEAAFGTMVALFVDETRESAKTIAYEMSFSAPRLLWTLDDAATLVYGAPGGLVVACGKKYFVTTSLTNTPATPTPSALPDFSSDITAADAYRVGLADGSIYHLMNALQSNAFWNLEVGGINHPITALSAWEDGMQGLWGVAARNNATLLEQVPLTADEDATLAQWTDGRTLIPSAGITGDIKAITALSRHELQPLPDPSQGAPAEITSKGALLVGTRDDGLFAVVEVSTLTENDGVFPASKETFVGIQPFWQPTSG